MKFVLKFGFFFLIFFINLLSPVYLPSQSWELIEILPDRPDLYSVFFHDTSRGLVAGSQGALYKTTDGGRKWSKINYQEIQ
jgi:photosystem II stability/assembly factor-like uncharacterized protein